MNPINPENYSAQLDEKLAQLREQFGHLKLPHIEVFESEPLHYRMRAEFRIWQQNGKAHYAMTRQSDKPGEKQPYIITEFPVASALINRLMPELLQAINQTEVLRRKLFRVDFLTTLSGEALISLIYHKPLQDDWIAAADVLRTKLGADIIGRSRKQKVVLGSDYVTEKLNVAGRIYTYQQVEGSFTQPNAGVNEKMIDWARQQCQQLSAEKNQGDLLELYCGNGNFTCVLANHYRRVLATEISKTSVRSASLNFSANGVDNVTVVRMSSEELTAALNGVRPFRRLREVDLDSYHFTTVFVDPPRAGLDAETLALVSRFDNIIYISCNPATLKENIEALADSHSISSFAVFDQFPYTHHLECGAVLSR